MKLETIYIYILALFLLSVKDKSIINYLQCVSVLSAAAGGATSLEFVVLEFMRLGVVFVLAGFANPYNSKLWIQIAAIAAHGQAMEEICAVTEECAVLPSQFWTIV